MHPLTRYREARGLTIEAFAALVGSSKSSISRIETRSQDPSFDLLRRIVAECGGELTERDFVQNGRETEAA